MNFSASVNKYQKYLNPLVKWKILDTASLLKISNYQGCYYSFCQMMRKLKKRELIFWEPLADCRKKVIYLTRDAHKEITHQTPYLMDDRIIFHDAVVSNLTRTFLEIKYFHDCQLSHEFSGNKKWNFANILEPDSIIFGQNKGINFNIAIEVELTQKSKDRIVEKIDAYIKSEFFNSVIYIFNKRNVFDSYIGLVKEMETNASSPIYKKGIGQKIFFLFKEELANFPVNFFDDPLFVNNQERKFGEVMDA